MLFFIIIQGFAIPHFSNALDCDACIHNFCQKKLSVIGMLELIGQIAMDRTANILYFHMKSLDALSYSCAYELDNVKLEKIWNVDFTFARAVDQKTRDVYLSRENSVFKLNPIDGFANGVTIFNKTVWHMQFKDKLYYTEYKIKGLKVFEDGVHRGLEALSFFEIDDFVVDKNNNIYFMHQYSLYGLKHGAKNATLVSAEIYELATDSVGELYCIEPFTRGLYKLDYEKDVLVFVGALSTGTPYRIVFTKENHIVYSDVEVNVIYLLLPSGDGCKLNPIRTDKKVVKTFTVDPK